MLLNRDNTVQKLPKFLFLILLTTSLTFGQKKSSNASFISFFAGDLSIQSEKFLDYYDSKNDLTFGIGFGFPLSNAISTDVSVSYFEKKSTYIAGLNNNASALLKQLILNAGFQVHLLPNRIVGLSFLGGVNYSLIDEERKSQDGEFVYEIEDEGNFGVYGGANLELSLGRAPIAIFADAKYTYSWNPVLEYADTYREVKYTVGIKLYLTSRWK
jgi:hypothetical protein